MCVSCDQCIHETPVTDHCEDISQWLVLAVITHDTSSYDWVTKKYFSIMAQQEEPQSWAAKRREAERRNSDNEAQQVRIKSIQLNLSYLIRRPQQSIPRQCFWFLEMSFVRGWATMGWSQSSASTSTRSYTLTMTAAPPSTTPSPCSATSVPCLAPWLPTSSLVNSRPSSTSPSSTFSVTFSRLLQQFLL